MKKCVYAGSFDPVTNGHLWMIEEGAKLFERLVVAIGINPDKKTTFTFNERKDMLSKTLGHIPNVWIDSFKNQFLINYTKSAGAGHILRGIRSGEDYEYERGMRNINSDLNNKISTVFLMPPREMAEVSSSLVKGLVGPKGWENTVKKYIPKPVFQRFLEKYDGYSSRWKTHWKKIDLKYDLKEVYDELKLAYSEPHRKYHNLVHLSDCFEELDELKKTDHIITKPDMTHILDIVLWFHDAIYEPLSKRNEEKSAKLFEVMVKKTKKYDKISIDWIKELILATKHNSKPKAFYEEIITDIDLAVLGKSPEEFDEYERNIRKEYQKVPNKQFKKGRKKVLKGFLNRDEIYHVDFFKQKYEDQARKNLNRSIERLGRKS